jgi:hypothetical protein
VEAIKGVGKLGGGVLRRVREKKRSNNAGHFFLGAVSGNCGLVGSRSRPSWSKLQTVGDSGYHNIPRLIARGKERVKKKSVSRRREKRELLG